SLTQALQNYTLLTVGDGLVSQIPALMISTATGIIVTRAASEASLGADTFRQITANPRVMGIVAAMLFGFALVPGLPKFPFLLISAIAAAAAFGTARSSRRSQALALSTADGGIDSANGA